jgi:hypothetical protein
MSGFPWKAEDYWTAKAAVAHWDPVGVSARYFILIGRQAETGGFEAKTLDILLSHLSGELRNTYRSQDLDRAMKSAGGLLEQLDAHATNVRVRNTGSSQPRPGQTSIEQVIAWGSRRSRVAVSQPAPTHTEALAPKWGTKHPELREALEGFDGLAEAARNAKQAKVGTESGPPQQSPASGRTGVAG